MMPDFNPDKYNGNPPSISRRTREKIALYVLILLVIAGIAIVAWFFSTANTFTVVATKVDDRVGTMDHYTTIVYSGIRTPDNIPEIPEESNNSDELKIDLSQLDVVYLSDVRDAYQNKGSKVITVDIAAIQKSETPQIYYVGSKKVAFFSVDQYTSQKSLSEITSDLKVQKVDITICVTKRSVMLGSFDGIDCVLCTEEKSPSEVSEGHIGNCLIARAAEIGSIGTLNISSSNLVSDKVYSPKWKTALNKTS